MLQPVSYAGLHRVAVVCDHSTEADPHSDDERIPALRSTSPDGQDPLRGDKQGQQGLQRSLQGFRCRSPLVQRLVQKGIDGEIAANEGPPPRAVETLGCHNQPSVLRWMVIDELARSRSVNRADGQACQRHTDQVEQGEVETREQTDCNSREPENPSGSGQKRILLKNTSEDVFFVALAGVLALAMGNL